MLLIVKLQSPLQLVSFRIPKPPSEKKKKRKAASSYFQVGEKQKPEEQGPLPCRGWDAKGTSRLGTQNRGHSSPLSRAGRLGPCIIPRNTYQETDREAHKALLLGDLQTDYKFTGDNRGI